MQFAEHEKPDWMRRDDELSRHNQHIRREHERMRREREQQGTSGTCRHAPQLPVIWSYARAAVNVAIR